MTRHPARPFLVVLPAMLLVGCFMTEHPLDVAPMHDRDADLLGSWLCVPDDATPEIGTATIVVAPDGPRSYAVTFGEGDKAPEKYSAFASDTPAGRLLNVREVKQPPKDDWVFVRYTFPRRGVLSIELLNDEVMTGTDPHPSAVRAALSRLKQDPELFAGFCVCTRMRPVTK